MVYLCLFEGFGRIGFFKWIIMDEINPICPFGASLLCFLAHEAPSSMRGIVLQVLPIALQCLRITSCLQMYLSVLRAHFTIFLPDQKATDKLLESTNIVSQWNFINFAVTGPVQRLPFPSHQEDHSLLDTYVCRRPSIRGSKAVPSAGGCEKRLRSWRSIWWFIPVPGIRWRLPAPRPRVLETWRGREGWS